LPATVWKQWQRGKVRFCETAPTVVEFHKSVVGPKPLADFVLRDNLACPFHQENKQGKGKVQEALSVRRQGQAGPPPDPKS
jgi:hypothetical protein